MKAITHDGWVGPDGLEVREVATPVVGDDQVLIAVHAASVNPADWYVIRRAVDVAPRHRAAPTARRHPRPGPSRGTSRRSVER